MGKTKYYTFYHNDMDGKSAAWCVHLYLKRIGYDDSPVRYQRHGYADPWKLSYIDKDTIVFLVDLSFTDDTKNKLYEICNMAKKVIWIDHHQSSADLITKDRDVCSIPNLLMCINNNACGALLTFTYLNFYDKLTYAPDGLGNIFEFSFDYNIGKAYVHANGAPVNTMSFIQFPRWLNLVDDYDRWQNRFPQTNRFILGTESKNTAITCRNDSGEVVFNDNFWNSLFKMNELDKYIADGDTIMQYLNCRYMRELINCFEYTLPDGQIMLCKNGNGNSWNFQNEIKNYPAVCLFNFSGKNGIWSYSVYSDADSDFDCAKFCEQYGGGGHKHAAGFQAKKSIFTPC